MARARVFGRLRPGHTAGHHVTFWSGVRVTGVGAPFRSSGVTAISTTGEYSSSGTPTLGLPCTGYHFASSARAPRVAPHNANRQPKITISIARLFNTISIPFQSPVAATFSMWAILLGPTVKVDFLDVRDVLSLHLAQLELYGRAAARHLPR